MKTFTYNLTHDTLQNTIHLDEYNEIKGAKSILIQLFSGENIEKIQHILDELKVMFEDAVIIGATTDGEIEDDIVSTENSVVSISIFEHTKLKSYYTDEEDDFEAGVLMAKHLVSKNAKLLISFADGLLTNGEKYLDGIYSINKNIMVAGGLAGDNAEFKECYVICDGTIYNKGAVGVILDSTVLQVENFYNFGWEKIGLEHTITSAKENCVFTIDGITVVDFYKKYLGEEIAEELPATAVEFPLIKTENGVDIARAATGKHADGSLSFAGNIKVGDKVYLGVGNSNKILLHDLQANMESVDVESFFIYTCMARRRFMLHLTAKELTPFSNVAKTSGFFTYGEFYTEQTPKLLNETLTVVALSEDTTGKSVHSIAHLDKKKFTSAQYKTYKAMSHLVTQIVGEYNIVNQKLKHKVYLEKLHSMESISKYQLLVDSMSEGMLICDEDYKIIDMNSAVIKLLGYSREELLGTKIIDYALKSSIHENSYFKKEHNDIKKKMEITLLHKDNTKIYSLISQRSIPLKGKSIYMAIIVDISDLKEKDRQLMFQSKLAQMGEMINMIAHQWRQPLNAINAAAMKINMKNTLGVLESEEVDTTTQFIQDMAQQMSETINDFMNLSKIDSTTEYISLNKLFDEVLNLIKVQLDALKIEVRIVKKENLFIMTKKQELSHVLINILVNARDVLGESMQKKKLITLEPYMQGDDCYINVVDNGGGIEDVIMESIFDLHFTTKKQGKGTGIGLYMSKKIANEFLNGDIVVENCNDGAKFSIILRECRGESNV